MKTVAKTEEDEMRKIDAKFEPVDGDTFEKLLEKAERCGRELHPKSQKAVWIDRHANATEKTQLVNAYHEGQSEQYCSGDW